MGCGPSSCGAVQPLELWAAWGCHHFGLDSVGPSPWEPQAACAHSSCCAVCAALVAGPWPFVACVELGAVRGAGATKRPREGRTRALLSEGRRPLQLLQQETEEQHRRGVALHYGRCGDDTVWLVGRPLQLPQHRHGVAPSGVGMSRSGWHGSSCELFTGIAWLRGRGQENSRLCVVAWKRGQDYWVEVLVNVVKCWFSSFYLIFGDFGFTLGSYMSTWVAEGITLALER